MGVYLGLLIITLGNELPGPKCYVRFQDFSRKYLTLECCLCINFAGHWRAQALYKKMQTLKSCGSLSYFTAFQKLGEAGVHF